MKIAVTGASGFVGRNLIKKLSEAGHECMAVVHGKRKIISSGGDLYAKMIVLDMSGYSALGNLTGACDCLVCLAWNGTRGAARMDRELQKYNYRHTMDAVKSAVSAGCRCVVTAGSQAEYGNVAGMIRESSAPDPNTEYGMYKLKLYEDASRYCACNGAALIEPRYFSLYGPGDTEETMIVSMAEKMIRDQSCSLTEGVQMWDFLYIDDAVSALVRLIEQAAPAGVYNFGSGDCRQLKDYINEMKDVIGSRSRLDYGAVPYPETGMVSIWPDVSKLKSTVGPYAQTSFRQGIREVVRELERKKYEKDQRPDTML